MFASGTEATVCSPPIRSPVKPPTSCRPLMKTLSLVANPCATSLIVTVVEDAVVSMTLFAGVAKSIVMLVPPPLPVAVALDVT